MYEFPTPGPVTVSARLRAGDATIMAEERDTIEVEVTPFDSTDASRQQAESTRVELLGDRLVIHAPEGGWIWRRGSIRVVARVPSDSSFDVNVASAGATVLGRWQRGSVNSASGDVEIAQVTGDLRVNTASGDIRAEYVGHDVKANSASGDIELGSVGGSAVLHSASGDLRIQDTGGSAQARTASGDIDVLRARNGEVKAQSASGDVTTSVLAGTSVYLDVRSVSGRTRSDLQVHDAPPAAVKESGGQLALRVQTVSGDIAVLRAA